jgi:hypothetical protein
MYTLAYHYSKAYEGDNEPTYTSSAIVDLAQGDLDTAIALLDLFTPATPTQGDNDHE